MKLEFAFLADAGVAQPETGVFSVLNGGINLIRCRQFPGEVANIHLIGRISFEPAAGGAGHQVTIRVMAPNGEAIGPEFRDVPLTVPSSSLGADRGTQVTLSFAFQNLVLPTRGVYRFVVLVDNVKLGEVAIDVLPMEDLK